MRKFASVEDVWFWYLGSRELVNGSAHQRKGHSCWPIAVLDVDRILLRLYNAKTIGDRHIAIGRKYFVEQRSPDPNCPAEEEDARLWGELMDAIAPFLVKMEALDAGSVGSRG